MIETKMKVLVLGASGMLGNTILRYFSDKTDYECFGTVRSAKSVSLLPNHMRDHVLTGVDVENPDLLIGALLRVRPQVVINCIGLVKQLAESADPLAAIPVNSILPHRLARICKLADSRLIHISTDCVFSGSRGMYTEDDQPDSNDLYGRSKCLGEVNYPNSITLRTSIIGHELSSSQSLLEWFLAQEGTAKGFRRAIFSGFPTVEISRIIADYVIPASEMAGIFNLSADPISKYDLLTLVSRVYHKDIEIIPDDHLVIDRSLDSTRFRKLTRFEPRPWQQMIKAMCEFG